MQAPALLAMRAFHKIFNECTVLAMLPWRCSSWTLALLPKCPGPRTKVSGPMVRTISALGPNCLGAKMPWCRSVWTLWHQWSSGAEVSRFRTV